MIVFRNVTKQFDDAFAVKDIDFAIDPGELVMITGSSGSGKTTLMRLLTREYKTTVGEIFFDSTQLNSIKSGKIHHHRRKIGVIFQDYKLLQDLNVWENIALALSIIGTKDSEIERRVTDLLELVSLTDKAFHFPVQLSGGEAQRVSIARALSTAPKVIFADEPTGNLDPEASKNVISLLKKINSLGTTVLITTHNTDVKKWLGEVRHLHIEKGELLHDTKASDSQKTDSHLRGKKSKESTQTPDHEEETGNEEETDKEGEISKEESVHQDGQDHQKKTKPRLGFSFFSIFGKKNDTDEEKEVKKTETESKFDTTTDIEVQSEAKSKVKHTADSKKSAKTKKQTKEADDEKVAIEIEDL